MEYEYPYEDEFGNYRFATVGGKHIKIYKELGLTVSMKQSGKFTNKNIFKSKETIERLKNKAKEIGCLNCCKEISEEVKTIAEENGIKSEVKQVTVFNEDGMKEINGHYITEINNKLYDYTGKQYLGSNNPDDIELRVYKHISNGFYAEDDIKVNTIDETIDYTNKNKNKLIMYKN